ncbi:hypothetical protein [Pseudalkalibacillus caeni]|uniref:Uncharacterized protein n=1 Tax=Exobacillus caeni TaxID=2574798 RepID=A0A5R9F1D8_9BACL|nr:hypothetical protein [Pseudalkalibacillus caeni]TLS36246.1 hypothetical protein FCL54_16565 [Pseudalkalibacillus caeni]
MRNIGNVNELDLTTAKEEDVQGLEVGNVRVVYYTPATANLVSKISFGNIGSTVVIEEGIQIHRGNLTVDKNNLHRLQGVFVSGNLILKNNITEEEVSEQIETLSVGGDIICPTHLAAILQSKVSELTGNVKTYENQYRILEGKTKLTMPLVRSMAPDTALFVRGKFVMVDDLPDDLLREKIATLDIQGKVIMKEEYLPFFYETVDDPNTLKLEIIPEGYTFIEGALELNTHNIERFNGDKLYVADAITFAEDVTKEQVQQHIGGLQSEEAIVCPGSIQSEVYKLLSDVSTTVLTYEDELLLVTGNHLLTASELESRDNKVTIINFGVTELDSGVTSELLKEKVANVDNFGVIRTAGKEHGAIQAKLRTASGVVQEKKEDEESEEKGIGNVNYLKL